MQAYQGEEFPAQARLKRKREFGKVMYRQQKAVGKHMVVLVAPRPKRGPKRSRLGIVCGVKVAKRAVRRHQIKRWVREFYRRELQQQLHGHDCVVLLRRDLPEEGHAAVQMELSHLIPKALEASAQPGSGRGPRRGKAARKWQQRQQGDSVQHQPKEQP